MSSSHGQKVTTDPETQNNPKNENPGVVTSDSLAAENLNSGGDFAADSSTSGLMSQPSKSTTTNTTDTSGATRLDPAPDAEARKASEEWSESAALNTGLGQEGNTSSSGSAGGGVSDTTNTNTANLAEPGVNPPSLDNEFKPKGKNITEGGFDSDAPNASFNADVDSKDDPARVAVGGMQENNTPFAGGAGPREGKVSNDGQYDVLKDASA